MRIPYGRHRKTSGSSGIMPEILMASGLFSLLIVGGILTITYLQDERTEKAHMTANDEVDAIIRLIEESKAEDLLSTPGRSSENSSFDRVSYMTCASLVEQKERFDLRMVRVNGLVMEPTDEPNDLCISDMREQVGTRTVGMVKGAGIVPVYESLPLNRLDIVTPGNE